MKMNTTLHKNYNDNTYLRLKNDNNNDNKRDKVN